MNRPSIKKLLLQVQQATWELKRTFSQKQKKTIQNLAR